MLILHHVIAVRIVCEKCIPSQNVDLGKSSTGSLFFLHTPVRVPSLYLPPPPHALPRTFAFTSVSSLRSPKSKKVPVVALLQICAPRITQKLCIGLLLCIEEEGTHSDSCDELVSSLFRSRSG